MTNSILNEVTHLRIYLQHWQGKYDRMDCVAEADCMGKHSQYQCARNLMLCLATGIGTLAANTHAT